MPAAPRVREGGRVTCQPTREELDGGSETPAGVWAVWSRGNVSGRWWLIPHDETAKAWAVEHNVKWVERHYGSFTPARLAARPA